MLTDENATWVKYHIFCHTHTTLHTTKQWCAHVIMSHHTTHHMSHNGAVVHKGHHSCRATSIPSATLVLCPSASFFHPADSQALVFAQPTHGLYCQSGCCLVITNTRTAPKPGLYCQGWVLHMCSTTVTCLQSQ